MQSAQTAQNLPKVLFLTYYWPPSGGSGVQRPLKFVKYLYKFGWEPVVYTVQNGDFPEIDPSLQKDIPTNLTVIKKAIFEPFAIYKWFTGKKKDYKLVAGYLHQKKPATLAERLSLWIRSNLFIPDARMFWIGPSYLYLRKFLKNNPDIKAIITTGPPHSVHVIGLKLKKYTKLPWIADFRDPWTQIDYWEDLKMHPWARKRHQYLEKQVLKWADKVVCVSPEWGNGLAQIGHRHIDYISNGFDPEDVYTPETVSLDNDFTLVHIGMMGKSRNHEVFWRVLNELISENERFAEKCKVKLYGKVDETVPELIQKYRLQPWVQIYPYVPHSEVIKVQQSAQVLYLSVNQTANAMGILTGKIYEYLAAKRPILCIGPPNGEAAKVLYDTQTGYVSDFNDVQTLKYNLLLLFDNYRMQKPFLGGMNIEKYSRISQTRQLAQLLNSVC